MADDHNQRPFRSNDLGGPRPGRTGPSGTDPLAELARLIGQNDPFAEFGGDAARRNAAQPAPQPPPEVDWPAPPSAPGYPPQPVHAAQDADLYHTGAAAPGYQDAGLDPAPYAQDPYDPNNVQYSETDYYDDPPPRRRMGVLAIAAVFALAVIGTAGAFGYRALFGSSNSGPPPVIKAESTPSKIVPEPKETASNKLINDRVGANGQGEKLVSREEQPVEIKPAGVLPQAQSIHSGSIQSGSIQPGLGSGVIAGAEPKRIRTIVIRPDQASMGAPQPSQAQASDAPPTPEPRVTNITPRQSAPPPVERAETPMVEPPPRPTTTARAAPPPPSNAPLSLTPGGASAPAPAPARTAAVPPQPQASGGSGFAVQLSSRRSEAEAQAAFNSLQSQYPGHLGGQQPLIRRVDLGEKGIYYRAMVGPFGSSEQANQLCNSLKSAGGSCFVQRI